MPFNGVCRVLQSLEQFQDAFLASNESNLDNQIFNTSAIDIQTVDTNNFEGQSFSEDVGSIEDTIKIAGAIPRDSLITMQS